MKKKESSLCVSKVNVDLLEELVNEKVIESIPVADVIIIPDKTLANDNSVQWMFPQGTESLFDFLKKSENHELGTVDIAEGNTGELQQHHDLLELATIVIKTAAFNVVINLISSYIYDFLKIKRKHADEVDVKLKIVRKEKSTTTSIEYKGSVSDFKTVMDSVNDKKHK